LRINFQDHSMPFLDASSSEFRKLRETGAYLVDKSMAIEVRPKVL
jgi:hypothetical protein